MRLELEQIKYIEDYLTGMLSESEEKAFEEKMLKDKDFAREIEIQKLLIERLKIIEIKNNVNAAHKRYVSNHNNSSSNNRLIVVKPKKSVIAARQIYVSNHNNSSSRKKMYLDGDLIIIAIIIAAIIIAGIFLLNSNKSFNELTPNQLFINPPILQADIPYSNYTVNAEKGKVITYSSGTKIYIPPHAFLDSVGNIVAGEIHIHYREFDDPIDFFISGIPMDINVNGKTFSMESYAMCDINATLNGKQLKVNPKAPISVFQSSFSDDNTNELFFLDTINKKWLNKGKDILFVKKDFTLSMIEKPKPKVFDNDFMEPIKPRLANPYGYQFDIVPEDSNEFPELAGLKNITFEVDENETSYNPEDADVFWSDVKVEKTSVKGNYQITFFNEYTNRKAQYIVWPVFEEEDAYDEALAVFEKELLKYEKIRTQKDKEETDEILAVKLLKRQYDSINKINKVEPGAVIYDNKKNKAAPLQKQQTQILINSELNYKRVELIANNLLSKKQEVILLAIPQKELYKSAELINKTYTNNKEYIELKNKLNKLLMSDLVPNASKDDYKNKNQKQILAAKKDIEKRYAILIDASLKYNRIRSKVVRSFEIDGFGIWNCSVIDKFMLGDTQIKAEFYDVLGDMNVTEIVFVDQERNSIVRLNRQMFSHFKFYKNNKNIIWAVTSDKRIIYYNDFKNLPNVPEYTFNLETLEGYEDQYDSFAEFRGALKELIK